MFCDSQLSIAMERSKAEVDRYISSAQSAFPSAKEKPIKGFLFAKLYFEAKEYELAKRHVSEYLSVHERDPKAHKFLGQLYERDGDINKAIGCYKRSVDLNPAQRDLVLKVAELLCSLPDGDSRAEFWVEKAAKLLPGSPAVYLLKEKLLSSKGQQGWNLLFDLLQSELQIRPDNAHINIKLVQLYYSDGRLEEAVKHCLATEERGTLCYNLDWYSTVVPTLQEFLTQPSVFSNDNICQKIQRALLLAHCRLLRLTLSERGVQQSVKALQRFDHAMQSMKMLSTIDKLSEGFSELRGHIYMYAGTLLLKMAQEKELHWKAVVDLAALCYLLAYQVPRPKKTSSKGDQKMHQLFDLMACDRKSQSGHMLLNLSHDSDLSVKQILEKFGNRSGQQSLFEVLFGTQALIESSFIGNDELQSNVTRAPEIADLIKWDHGAILLHGGDLQHLVWLGLQWELVGQRAVFRDWLKKLFPRLPIETIKLDTNTPESIALLDLEVFLCGVVFTSQTRLQETLRAVASSQDQEPRCLPLQIIERLSTQRQRDWWDAVYSLVHKKAPLGMSAKLRMTVQQGLSTVRAGEKHGLQPALVIHWAQHLSETGGRVNFNYKKEYISRSMHYWNVVLPLLEKIRRHRSVPEPLEPMFIHFHTKDIQISAVESFDEEAKIVFALLQDTEGKTEEAIATLETLDCISSHWRLAQIFQRLYEEAGSGEENKHGCIVYLRMFRKYLWKIYCSDASEIETLPVSMEEVMDLLNDANQLLGEFGEAVDEEDEGQPAHTCPSPISQRAELDSSTSHIKFSTPSQIKTVPPLSMRQTTPPNWVEDQKAVLQMLCQKMEALKNEVHDIRDNSAVSTTSPHQRAHEGYTTETLQEPFPAAQGFQATTGPSGFYSQSHAYNSQYLPPETAGVTPTKATAYGINVPPHQHMYNYQQPTHMPPPPMTPACMYPPDKGYGAPLRFEATAASVLSPYTEEYYSHVAPQPSDKPPLPEPGYFTKPSVVVQPSKSAEGNPVDFGKLSFGQPIPFEPTQVSSFGAGVKDQSTPIAAFKFNSNFKSNDGDFTFSSVQVKNNSESLLGLLTSDMPTRKEGQLGEKCLVQDQTPSQGGIFNSGDKSSTGFSFISVAQNQNKSNLSGKTDQPFTFNASKPVLINLDTEEKGVESEESVNVEKDEDGPHFEPIVPLPDKVDVKTGEEEEEEMFCNRARLFRFESESKEWKERGVGSIKILRHKTSGKVRLLMRREQVLKICANHYISADMALKPNAGSDKSWVWYAIDYADEIAKPEQLAIRFKTIDEAALFKTKFEESQKALPRSPQKQDQQLEKQASTKALFSEAKESEFGAQFEKKAGDWDCSVCYVRNTSAAAQCVACQSPNLHMKSQPDNKSTETVKGFVDTAEPFTFEFGNEVPKLSSLGSSSQAYESFSQMPTNFKFGTSSTSCISADFLDQCGKMPEWWSCDRCAVSNEASAHYCTSCQTPNPSEKSSVDVAATQPLAVTCGSGFGTPFVKTKEWGIGQGKDKISNSFKFEPSSSQLEGAATSKGFSFSFPVPVGGFTFGTQEPVKQISPVESLKPTSGPASLVLKKIADQHKETESGTGTETDTLLSMTSADKSKEIENPIIFGKSDTFTLADFAISSHGKFQFGKKDPDFTQAGEQRFVSFQSSQMMDVPVDQEEEDVDKTEENDDIQFEPVVQMPDKVDLITGEEAEEVLYSQRVKLFRFDSDTRQWKERGVGNLKFLKNNENGRLRVLMRREQVLKVCANHWITTTMNLKALSGSDKAWMWLANDFSDGDAKLEQLAAKFKTPELAEDFKQKFEECQRLLLDIPLQTPHKLVDTGRTARLIQKAEEMKSGLKDLKSFLTDDKAKIKEDQSQVTIKNASSTSSFIIRPCAENTGPTLEWDDYDLQEKSLDDSVETSVYASPLADGPIPRNLFRFGESTSGFNFSFQPILSPSKLNQSRFSVGTDEESETTQEEERDGQYFEPVVPLPDLIETSTGEENEKVLFSHRAKLYRYDKDLCQWKERGIGELRILKDYDTERIRLVMRRDQVLKLCANHWISPSMKLEPMKGAEKAWVWSALDFSEGEGKVEQLAVRFKLQEVANSFKAFFEGAKQAQEERALVAPISTEDTVVFENTEEKTEHLGFHTPESRPPAPVKFPQDPFKDVDSPAKFVFGSDSLEKIFGSPPSSKEKHLGMMTSPKDETAVVSSSISKTVLRGLASQVTVTEPTSAMLAFNVPERGLDFRLFKDNPTAFWTSTSSSQFESQAVSQITSENASSVDLVDVQEKLSDQTDLEEVHVVFVREPTTAQAELARELMLPITFFCYQNEPGYISDDEVDDEDFETAVRKLSGKLYADTLDSGAAAWGMSAEAHVQAGCLECVVLSEKRPAPEEREKASSLQLPPATSYGGNSDTEAGEDMAEHLQTEVNKLHESLRMQTMCGIATVAMTSSSKAVGSELITTESQPNPFLDSTTVISTLDDSPIDLSTKSSNEPGSTSQDTHFAWENAGATLFGAGAVPKKEGDKEDSDKEEATNDVDIHFEPIVSLPEVEVKSGEEEEEVLFKERTKLYRWDRGMNQWKERGVGDIKILSHPQRGHCRVLMRREQVLKVCANHTITKDMELKPMSTNAFVWIATDYAEGDAKVVQLAAKFKTAELAESFRSKFEECQKNVSGR